MGFHLSQVVSSHKHYSAFVCKLCENLVSLDAVVTTSCSHPFCRTCITDWAQKQISEGDNSSCACPRCDKDLAAPSNKSNTGEDNGAAAAPAEAASLQIGDTSLMVQPLGEAQPLAMEVLKLIQVSCYLPTNGSANGAGTTPDTSAGGEHNHKDCKWVGDYGKWQGHPEIHLVNGINGEGKDHEVTNGTDIDREQYAHRLSQPSLFANNQNENQEAHEGAAAAADQKANLEIDFVPSNPAGRHSPADVPGGIDPTPQMLRGQSTRTSLPTNSNDENVHKRQFSPSSDAMDGKPMADNSAASFSDLMDGSSKQDLAESINGGFERSFGNVEWNNGSRNAFTPMSPSKISNKIATVEEERSVDLTTSKRSVAASNISSHHLEEDSSKALSSSDIGLSSEEAIERSEKLKKQANAKFNKGDFEGARSLYSDGITVMTSIKAISKEECSLVATLYSNRAVTYFREKVFDKCIDDCDKALKFEVTFEKSYIRKWRALMALGNFEEACACLEEAHQQIPNSRRIREELLKAREQKDVLTKVNTMIDGGNLEKAKETIKPLAQESDNIGLLLVAAMADAGLGFTESALEKVNKALRFNPNHVEALQLRGLVLFLSGEMEKGLRLLQELHSRHADNAEIEVKVEQCQNTLSAFSKGRNFAKRGRYKEAVEQFTFSMDDQSLPLPASTALYSLIKIERAEAFLLSKHYGDALKDCKDALESQTENAEAWALKAEIYMCLGRAAEAKEELLEVRHSWGHDNVVIEEAYRKANFEEKVRRVDDELMQLINDVEAGVEEKVIIDGRDGLIEKRSPGMHQSERHYASSDRRTEMGTSKRTKSHRSLQKGSEKDRRSNRKSRRDGGKESKRDRSRVRGEGSSRTMNTQMSSRTLNTTATGMSARTSGTRGTKGTKRASRKKSSRSLMKSDKKESEKRSSDA